MSKKIGAGAEDEDPFLLVDALFLQSRQDERVQRRLVLIVSGLRSDGGREAIRKPFHDAPWQRCPGHRMRHVLGHGRRKTRSEVAAVAKRGFQAADRPEARRRLAEFEDRFDTRTSAINSEQTYSKSWT